jgi:hypothetical protein
MLNNVFEIHKIPEPEQFNPSNYPFRKTKAEYCNSED